MNIRFQEKKYFRPVHLKYVEITVEHFPINKASGGATPLNIFRQFCFTYQMLIHWINDTLVRGIFPDSLKFEIITSA